MGLWLELRCDVQAPGSNRLGEPACHSLGGHSTPSALAGNTLAGVVCAKVAAEREARAGGWSEGASGWACPYRRDALTKP